MSGSVAIPPLLPVEQAPFTSKASGAVGTVCYWVLNDPLGNEKAAKVANIFALVVMLYFSPYFFILAVIDFVLVITNLSGKANEIIDSVKDLAQKSLNMLPKEGV